MKTYGILPLNDIQRISSRLTSDFRELRNVNFIIVGASGFLGKWIATSLAYMQSQDLIQGRLNFVVRDSDKVSELKSLPNLPNLKIVPIRSMDQTTFSHMEGDRTVVIYAASSTSNSGKPLKDNPESYLALPKILMNCLPKSETVFVHLSSGAVYTPSSRLKNGILRSEKVQSSSTDSYTAEKIILEQWLESKKNELNLITRNPRLFSFYGPGLHLDRHFAIGEFMKNGTRREPIIISGNPKNLRSYLHPSDAVHQIFKNCLVRDPTNAQIGSANVMNIETVAHVIAREFGVDVNILKAKSNNVDNYVPLDIPILPEKDFDLGISEWREWLEITQHFLN